LNSTGRLGVPISVKTGGVVHPSQEEVGQRRFTTKTKRGGHFQVRQTGGSQELAVSRCKDSDEEEKNVEGKQTESSEGEAPSKRIGAVGREQGGLQAKRDWG